jgi:hypothetical protein
VITRANPTIASLLGIIAGEAAELGVAGEVVEILTLAPAGFWRDAALAELQGDSIEAADMYRGMGAPTLEAGARFVAAERLLGEGRTADGLAELEKALAFYRSVRATFYLERGEALLREAKSA